MGLVVQQTPYKMLLSRPGVALLACRTIEARISSISVSLVLASRPDKLSKPGNPSDQIAQMV